MIDIWLESLSTFITDSSWIAPLFAFVAGILTSFTPCSLSSVPLIIGYVGSKDNKNTKKAFKLSLTFALGNAITFTILGVVATLTGSLIGNNATWWYFILGVLMLLMTLQIWDVFEIIPSSYLVSKNNKKGYLGALTAGVLAGVFSSPCSTPVLIALLAVVASSGNLVWGIILLLLYSIGHGILAVICGTSIGFVQKISKSQKYGKVSKILKVIMGICTCLIGFYMFYLAF